MIDNRFNHKTTEKKCISYWQKNKTFEFEKKGTDTFCIMMPPPNITGSLHMGHALTFSLQDILVRFQFKLGKKVLWQAGTDHAGIATEIIVENQLRQKKKESKQQIGRKKFIDEIWKWKEKSGSEIINQLKILGTSANWKRARFTMDDDLSNCVKKVFVDLYNQGLIYKDNRLINWDPKIKTAISDLEVVQENVTGSLWYIKYKIFDKQDHIIVATTRPETMLGDSAIAIHPKNKKLNHLIGKYAVVPLCERKIPIIADKYADPKKGSGAVKITPAHDFNDFAIGKKHNLEMINIFDKDAKINFKDLSNLHGLDRFEARKRIVFELQNLRLIKKIEKNEMVIPKGDRSNSIIEPMLTEQWFCDAKKLTKPIKKFILNKKIKFFPHNWVNSFNYWINNIEPWCISRQIWWGHRIPAWYTDDGRTIVAENLDEAKKIARKKYKIKDPLLSQDTDVLDTWFSSALWPFSTLGWPKTTNDFKEFYPTSVLITGFDIIFFWVARMVMMGIHFTGNIPFKHVYIHPLVRDEHGQKMSKSKGNVIDPVKLVNKYGADALRFTLVSMCSQGRDIKLSDKIVEDSRKFITKLWNVARFSSVNKFKLNDKFEINKIQLLINKWICHRFFEVQELVIKDLNNYNFNLASKNIYHFVWSDFCDLYIEFIKPYLHDENYLNEISCTFSWLFQHILIFINPFLPFVTEEIALKLGYTKNYTLSQKQIEKGKKNIFKVNDFYKINNLKTFIYDFRQFTNNNNISEKSIFVFAEKKPEWITINETIIKSVLKIKDINLAKKTYEKYDYFISSKIKFGTIKKETTRISNQIEKKIEHYKNEIKFFEKKLSNKEFLLKAPKKIIEIQKKKLNEAKKNLILLCNNKN